jgi:hypothetical protein
MTVLASILAGKKDARNPQFEILPTFGQGSILEKKKRRKRNP